MDRIRIAEALEAYNKAHPDTPKLRKDIGALLWPNAKEQSQGMNIYRLMAGTHSKIDPAWVPLLCEFLEVDANFLFNINP